MPGYILHLTAAQMFLKQTKKEQELFVNKQETNNFLIGNLMPDTTKDKANDTEKAIKDLQNYTLGIDELNVIQPADNSGNSGSGSGSGGSSSGSPSISDMFETIEVPNSMNKLADKFKEAIKNSDFTDIGKMLGDKLSSAMESIPWKTVYRKADNFG